MSEEPLTPEAAYERGYDDGVEQERASIAKELGRLDDRAITHWVAGFVRGYHLTRAAGTDEAASAAQEEDHG